MLSAEDCVLSVKASHRDALSSLIVLTSRSTTIFRWFVKVRKSLVPFLQLLGLARVTVHGEVINRHRDRHHQQNVNQAASNMKRKPEQPENKQNYNQSPK